MGIKNAKKKKAAQEEFADDQSGAAAGESAVGEQIDLIDVSPETSKEILRLAKKYNKSKKARMALTDAEVADKQNLVDAIKKANLQRLEDGSIRYHVHGFLITLKPCDEKLTVKDENDEGESVGCED